MDQGGGKVNMHSSLSALQLQAAVPCYPAFDASFRGPYVSGDRDGESCMDSVLRILYPPSVAENSFDPSPTEMSWNSELDSAFVAPGFDELADSVTFDIRRTRFYQGYNINPGADISHQMAFHRRIQVQQVPGNHNIQEHMTSDQGLPSALQKLVQKVNGDHEDRASAPAGCCGFSDACLIQDALDPAYFSFSSVTTDADMESLHSSGRVTDPALGGSYIHQSCREVSRLHYNFSEACELSAVVHSSISLRHKSATGSLGKEQKNGSGNVSSNSEVHDVAKGCCNQGYGGLSLVQQDLQFDGSRQTQLYITSQVSDQDPTVNHQNWPLSDVIFSSSDAPRSPSGDLASVCGVRLPAMPATTDERGPFRRLQPSVQDTSWNTGLSDHQYGLPQSGPMYNLPQDERTVGLSDLSKALIQRGNQGAHDMLALTTDSHLRQVTTLATKRPRRCSPVISEFGVLPVFSTIVSSEIQASEFSVSTESSMGLAHVQPGSDPDGSILRRKRKAVSDESSWFGILHHEWSPATVLKCSTEQAKSAHEVSIQQVSSHVCASRLTVTQEFQPGTPEGRELRAAASSLMDLCTELVPPVPLAMRRPPKLTDLDMTRLIQAYKQLSASHVLRTLQQFPFVKEADVYSVHPAELISGAGQYFFSETKYGSIKKPTRLRITQNGHRWKQQGRTYAIQEGGRTVAFKTYLSYVPLKNNGKQVYPQISSGPEETKSCSSAHGDGHVGVPLAVPVSAPLSTTALRCVKQTQPASSNKQSTEKGDPSTWVCSKLAPHRKWALWTMEEIALAEDVEMERRTFKRGGLPRPFPVLCKIGCRTPVEEHGCRSQEIPFAVPITPPPQNPLIQARTRKLRQHVRRVAKKARYTCSTVTIATPPPSVGRTEGSSTNGTYGGAPFRDPATSGNFLL